MNSRLSQDAADALAGHEARQAFRDAERARWAAAQPQKIVSVWAPTMEAHERQALEKYIIDEALPF